MAPREPAPVSIQQILANNIRTARRKLGYSQMQLAERADISPSHMNELEQAKKWISADSMERIAGALGLEPFMLLLPPGYSQATDAFSLLAEFAASVREQVDGALDSTLKDVLRRRRGYGPTPEHDDEPGDSEEPPGS